MMEVQRIIDVADIVNGGTPSTSEPSYWDGDIEWLTPKDMGQSKTRYISCGERRISANGVAHSSAKVLPPRSVILSSRAPIGYVAINTVPMATNQGCKGLIPSEKIISEYLFYFLLKSNKLLNDLGTGATFKELSGRRLGEVFIPLPSLLEQQRIVDILDAEFAKIDALKANAEKNLQNAKDLFQSVLSKELEPKKGWESSKLNVVADIINGRAYSKEELLSSGKYRVLRVGNFFTNDSWYYSDMELSEDKYCQPGDLLYAWSASFGPRIWEGEKVIFHYHIWKIIPATILDKQFLFYWLQSKQLTSQVMSSLHGSTMTHITKGIMEATTIDFPSINKQREIATHLNITKAKCKALQENYTRTLALCDDLKQALLRKAFAGS